jgi:hypothetical protein
MKIVAGRSVSPRGAISPNGIISPINGSNEYNFPANRGKIKWDFSYAGPARVRNLDGETDRCRNNTESRQWGSLNPSSTTSDTLFPFMATMRFGQACSDANWNPSDCSCKQEIRLSWQYDSKVSAQAVTKTGRWCFNMPGRSALAAVDDVCIVSVARKNVVGEDDFKIVDAGRGAVVKECNRDFQEDRLVDLVHLAANIYSYSKGKTLTTGVPGLDPIVRILWQQYHKDKILGNIESLLTNPWIKKDGACGEDENQVVLRKSRTEYLNGNDEFEIIMSATSYMEVAGITHWKASARLKSGFHLTGVLLQNFVTPPNTYCCTRSYGSFIAKSMFGPSDGNTTAIYQEFAGGFLNHAQANFSGVLPYNSALGAYTITEEIGEKHGNPIPNCNTIINDRDEDTVVPDQQTGAFIVARGNELWYVNETPVNKLNYRVFDVQGRLLLEGENAGNDILLGQLPSSTPGHIHLVQIQADGISKTFKFLKP